MVLDCFILVVVGKYKNERWGDYKKDILEPATETYTVDNKELVFEGDVRDLYLDDEDFSKVTGHYYEITRITYDGKPIDVEIAI